LPRLIRIGRPSIAERGVRSAEKAVSPLAWFTDLSCSEVAARLRSHFTDRFEAAEGTLAPADLDAAAALVASKYGTAAWINRIP
jgi:lipoate-protein ligase A